MVYIYTYKRNLDGTYDRPWNELYGPDDMKRECNYMVVSNPDEAAKHQLHIKTLCLVGTFDQATGKCDILPSPDELIDLSVPYKQIMNLRGANNG